MNAFDDSLFINVQPISPLLIISSIIALHNIEHDVLM